MIEALSPKMLRPRKFNFIGGAVCLDFCNSVGGKRGVRPKEYLNSYGDFLAWCEQADLPISGHLNAWRKKALKNNAEPAAVLQRAIKLREALYKIFLAIIGGKKPAAGEFT